MELEVLHNGRHLTNFPSSICHSIEKRYVLCGETKKEKFLKYFVNAYIFGKISSHCFCIWALKRTVLHYIVLFNAGFLQAAIDKFYIDDYLDSFDFLEEVISAPEGVCKMLADSGFELTICLMVHKLSKRFQVRAFSKS